MRSSSAHGLLLVTLLMVLITETSSRRALKHIRPFNNSISAAFVFGDSTVDSGNNNYLETPFKANFRPYGMEFKNHIATGRFTDGKLVTDFMASYVGIKEYMPPYLDPQLSLEDLMTGVSFACGGSGFDPVTVSIVKGVDSMENQLQRFKEYKAILKAAIGKEKTETLISKAVFLISSGTNDIMVTYLMTPSRRFTHDIDSYETFLLKRVEEFIEGLRKEGARFIAMVGMPPIGCLPLMITFSAAGDVENRACNDNISSIAIDYNRKLKEKVEAMQKPNSPIIYGDIYKPLDDMIRNPSQYGFENVNDGCCGSGLFETTLLCNCNTPVCENPSRYVFFDSVHPSEATYKHIFDNLRPLIDRAIQDYHL